MRLVLPQPRAEPATARCIDRCMEHSSSQICAESMSAAQRIDVLIGGAGFAGLALAIALRQGLGPSFSVAVADPALARAGADARASAIVAAARRLFETIGVWDEVAGEAQPILDMVITDSRLQDAVRPTFLTFDGDVAPGEPFGHMIENAPLLAALVEKAKDEGVDCCGRPRSPTFELRATRCRRRAVSDGDTICRRVCWSPPMARARGSASAPASRATAGATTSPRIVDHGRARARSPRPRRGAFPAGRAVRDPAAQARSARPPLVDRLDRGGARGRTHRRAARR